MSVLVTFLFSVIILRIGYIELILSPRLKAKAIDQWTRDIPITAERGDIFDRNGVALADTNTTYTIFVRPNSVKDKESTAKSLAGILKLDEFKLLEKIKSKVSELTIAKQIDKSVMMSIYNSDVSGVYYSQNITRAYPYSDFMTQILGFTNIDGQGQSGVEAFYNQYLSGKNGKILTETDLVGRELNNNVTQYIAGQRGNNVHLTIDYYIQAFAEKAVTEAFLKYNAKNTSCIVMNPQNGEILAMAQRPSFDLNNVPRNDIVKLFKDSKSTLVSNVFEPGSTFKIVTSAIGLETNSVDRNYGFYCPGSRVVDGKKIKCWRTIGHGSQKFDQGVQNSCNCLFMDIAQRVGSKKFYDYINKFGLTNKTGVDISGEASGLTIPLSAVKNVDLARIGFGQAIAVTPIELLTACSAVINGGKMVKPRILDKVASSEGKVILSGYQNTLSTIISEKTSTAMREILESVVSVGSGKNAKVDGYRIGGKTGTAQKYENGVIANGKYVSTFLGFAPADNPEYIVLMIVDEPQGGVYYGSIVSAPYVGEIFKSIFTYKGTPPQKTEDIPTMIMPNLIGMSSASALLELKKMGMYCEIEQDLDTVNRQIPSPGSYINKNNIVFIGR